MSDRSVPDGWDCHVHVFDSAARPVPGHYVPAPAPLAEVEAHGAAHGIGHLVIVQPSVYAVDNTVLVRALRAGGGRHRGIAVVADEVTEAAIDELHDAGVRGVRCNLVSPVGNGPQSLVRLAPLLAARGWHVQWYAHGEQLPVVAAWQRRTGLAFVLDHLAGLAATPEPSAAAWAALRALADGGAWIKLSGWYRLRCDEPYDAIVPAIARIAPNFAGRMVWGSDWPHTSLPRTPDSRHAALLDPVRRALGADALDRILRDNPARLYS